MLQNSQHKAGHSTEHSKGGARRCFESSPEGDCNSWDITWTRESQGKTWNNIPPSTFSLFPGPTDPRCFLPLLQGFWIHFSLSPSMHPEPHCSCHRLRAYGYILFATPGLLTSAVLALRFLLQPVSPSGVALRPVAPCELCKESPFSLSCHHHHVEVPAFLGRYLSFKSRHRFTGEEQRWVDRVEEKRG